MSVDDFLTLLSADMEQDLLPSLVTADNITEFFGEYDAWQVRTVADTMFACLRTGGFGLEIGPIRGGRTFVPQRRNLLLLLLGCPQTWILRE